MKKMNEGIKERIKEIRTTQKMTQEKFANRLKTSRANIAGYEAGTRVPSEAAINNICREFNINEEWLRYGIGEMFIELSKKDELILWASKALSDQETTFRNKFVDMLYKLDENDWEVLVNVAETLVKQRKKDQG